MGIQLLNQTQQNFFSDRYVQMLRLTNLYCVEGLVDDLNSLVFDLHNRASEFVRKSAHEQRCWNWEKKHSQASEHAATQKAIEKVEGYTGLNRNPNVDIRLAKTQQLTITNVQVSA